MIEIKVLSHFVAVKPLALIFGLFSTQKNDECCFSIQLNFLSVIIVKLGFLEFGNSFTFILGDKVAMEGKVEHKFDMKPRHENMDDYGKLCRERTKKSMIKNRQVQVAFHVYH